MIKPDLTFARYEEKYLLKYEQYEKLSLFLEDITTPDLYPEYKVNNIYYDTDSYDIIRHSIEKPLYKEKLRLRYYGDTFPEDGAVFLELKKKFEGVVYKRRIVLNNSVINEALSGSDFYVDDDYEQVAEEIKSFIASLTPLSREIAISYKRTALLGEGDLRITFDKEVFLSFAGSEYDLLPPDYVIMELKTNSAMPLCLARFFSENSIFPANYSKYKTAYMNYIYENNGEENILLCLS